jgi:HEAT repeat protein
MLDQAFEALKSYDWGTDPAVLSPIDKAVVATHGNDAARTELESRLAAVLTTNVSRDAKDFVCRTLTVIGTAASVATLADLLGESDHSHMARYALERIPAPEAAQVMRDALPKLSGPLKIGVIGSLGVRRDVDSVPALAALLDDAEFSTSAAIALGDIATPQAAQALARAKTTDSEAQRGAVADANLACAEALLADGNKAGALALYKSLIGQDQPKHVRLAGTRGMLACAGESQ